MGTMNAAYVRVSDAKTAAALEAAEPTADTERGTKFYVIEFSEDEFRCPDRRLRNLSARLKTDVVWLSFQSTVDSFQFHHWRDGALLRSLIYGCFEHERTWERAEGEPEPWERRAFFEPNGLKFVLEYETDPAARSELQRIYRDAELTTGQIHPSVDAREAVRHAAAHYRLPGWLDD